MIKRFNDFVSINENMVVKPDSYYTQFNLPVDGIKPASVEANDIEYLLNKKRRVAWVDKKFDETHDEFVKRMDSKGLIPIKLYDIKSDIAKDKIKELSNGGWSEFGSNRQVDNEYLVYLPNYKEQAELAHKELLRRGGWWYQTEPVADIYLARLMGYGEQYIIPYIRKYFPDFDVYEYIEKNPRNKLIS
jgi:hypothetical protein|tara:strand:+ start:384 stop:950 length:567 start_codon:yes stop_codon:yes gene_type:complete